MQFFHFPASLRGRLLGKRTPTTQPIDSSPTNSYRPMKFCKKIHFFVKKTQFFHFPASLRGRLLGKRTPTTPPIDSSPKKTYRPMKSCKKIHFLLLKIEFFFKKCNFFTFRHPCVVVYLRITPQRPRQSIPRLE